MNNTRWTVAAVTLAAFALMPLAARGQDVALMGKTDRKAMGGLGVFSVTAISAKGSKINFTATDFNYSVRVTLDGTTQMPSGQSARAIVLGTEFGESSMKLSQAVDMGTVFTSLSIELGAGHTMTLKDAYIISLQLMDYGGKLVQSMAFRFKDVEMK